MWVDTVKRWFSVGYTVDMTRSTTPDGLREAILAISRNLLNEGGPASLSMREVARRAGCTHQAPYHYFQGREAILVVLVEEGYRRLEEALAQARRANEGAAPDVITRAAGCAYLTCALANPGVFRIMFRSDMYDSDAHPQVRTASLAATFMASRPSPSTGRPPSVLVNKCAAVPWRRSMLPISLTDSEGSVNPNVATEQS